jgi:glycosyltransferase involved in cell wall biosynthesis
VNLLFPSPTFHPHVGGAESLMDDLAATLAERGHAVTIVTGSGEPSGTPESRRGARVLRVRYPAGGLVARLDALRDEAVAFLPSTAGKIRVLPNAVDLAAIRAARPASAPRPHVFFAGRLEPVKNAALLIEAFARAAATVDAPDLIVAGTGSQQTMIADLAAACGVAGRVRFLGAIARERVYALMRGALCLVVPSLAEGQPLVVLIVRYTADPDARATLRAQIAARDLGAWDIRRVADRHLEVLVR